MMEKPFPVSQVIKTTLCREVERQISLDVLKLQLINK